MMYTALWIAVGASVICAIIAVVTSSKKKR